MLALLMALLPLLPTTLLSGWQAYLTATTTKEQIESNVTIATLNAVVAARQAQAAVIQTGMGHKAFWVPWTIAAMCAVGWYAWGMIDSTWPGHVPHIAALPPQLLELTNQIWNNLFLSGGIALGASSIAGAIGRRK